MIRFLQRLRNKTYFVPALYALSALVFSLLVHMADQRLAGLGDLSVFLHETATARSVLGILAGALLSMITVTFSTIMVVLTLYSGQFSPRTLQDFLQSKVSLRVLGVFIGSFVYAIAQLFLLPGPKESALTLAASMGVMLSIVCLMLFAYFIHHVANSIQVNLVVERITHDIFSLIDRKKALRVRSREKRIDMELPEEHENLTYGEPEERKAWDIGYLQRVDSSALTHFATEHELVLRLEQSLGDYVTKETVLLSYWPQGAQTLDEEAVEKLHKCLEIGKERNSQEDVEYGLIKLVEVALRALSPGINDPNTAVFCIQKIGYVLAEIGMTKLHKTYYYDEDNTLRLVVNKIPFRDLLYTSFAQIRLYGGHDPLVLGACIDSLRYIADKGSTGIRNLCWQFSRYLLADIDPDALPSMDRAHLARNLRELSFATQHAGDEPLFPKKRDPAPPAKEAAGAEEEKEENN